MNQPNFVVKVIESQTGTVVQQIDVGPNKKKASRVDDGVNINLNHDKFHTEIVDLNAPVDRSEEGGADAPRG